MAAKRWSKHEKQKLLELYSKGGNYDSIGKELDRSPNAIKLRVEGIVYDNLAKGRKVNMLSRLLKVNGDKVKQMYYSHKSFKEGRGEEVVDVNFDNSNNDGGHSIFKRDDRIVEKKGLSTVSQEGGAKLNRIENENQVLEAVIKNYKMKKYLRELYVDGKLDKKSLKICKKLIE